MINTTAMQGYFQRAMAKGLLPKGIVLAANPFISYPGQGVGMCEVREIEDKAKNTAATLQKCSVPPKKLIVMGDSGGDGPHFAWGASVGATGGVLGVGPRHVLDYSALRSQRRAFSKPISSFSSLNRGLQSGILVYGIDG
jgi:hypothetical protein